MRKDTTAITAKSARKSPNRLITCAYQTRRITGMRRTSRNDSRGTAPAAAAAVDMGSGYLTTRTRAGARVHSRAELAGLYLRLKITGACAIMFNPNETESPRNAASRPRPHHARAEAGARRGASRHSVGLARKSGGSLDGRGT